MAHGYSRTTGKASVCISTSGPGATNFVTCLADAKMDSIPVIAITGQVGTSVLGTDAFQETPIIEVCRADAAACVGAEIPVAVSIGVAQWTPEIGAFPDRLIAAADHALYVAKNEGKNRHAVYQLSPPMVPEPDAVPDLALRRHA